MINEEKAMINKNDVLILKCIMALNNCDMVSAIKFAEHNQTCYKIAMAVANAKDDETKAEKQGLIDKACEWMSSHLQMQYDGFSSFIKDFRKAMKGGENE